MKILLQGFKGGSEAKKILFQGFKRGQGIWSYENTLPWIQEGGGGSGAMKILSTDSRGGGFRTLVIGV